MMKHIIRALSVFFISLLFPVITLAWNATGHMLVANIAYENLKPEVRDNIDTLVTLMHTQHVNIATFADLAVWPDTLHAQKIETYTHWHYIDATFSNDG